MPGFSNVTGDESIMFADNISLDGTERGGKITTDGQLLIGSTAAPHIRVGSLTSSGNTVTITTSAGSINLEAGASTPTTFQTDSGNAVPAASILNVNGSGGAHTQGSGNTLTVNLSSIPNGSLANSSVTLSNGNNITVTGSPVSLGGSATLNVSGTTNHAVQIGNASGSLTSISVGSTGQILQANSSADPTWSTPTYPSTSGTARKIIVSDGTNNVYSTETWAVPGTSGNVLTSNGTNWTSAAPSGPSSLSFATATLTSSQIKSLNGTPIAVVSAPGSGKVICVCSPIYLKFTYGGSNVFVAGASQYITLAYGTTFSVLGATGGSLSNASRLFTNTQIVASASSIGYVYGLNGAGVNSNTTTLSDLENAAINLYNPIATEISGNAANDNTIDVRFLYYIVTL